MSNRMMDRQLERQWHREEVALLRVRLPPQRRAPPEDPVPEDRALRRLRQRLAVRGAPTTTLMRTKKEIDKEIAALRVALKLKDRWNASTREKIEKAIL